jgi:hypothetical protein
MGGARLSCAASGGVFMMVRMQRFILLGLLALGATLALPSLSRADMEKYAAHMLALAQADAQWVTETTGDRPRCPSCPTRSGAT